MNHVKLQKRSSKIYKKVNELNKHFKTDPPVVTSPEFCLYCESTCIYFFKLCHPFRVRIIIISCFCYNHVTPSGVCNCQFNGRCIPFLHFFDSQPALSAVEVAPYRPFAPSCPSRLAQRIGTPLRVQSSSHLTLCPIFLQPFPQNSIDNNLKIKEEALIFYVFVIDAHLFGVEDLNVIFDRVFLVS